MNVPGRGIRLCICADRPRSAERRHAYLPSFRILIASCTLFWPSPTTSERCGPSAFVSGPQFTASGPSCSSGHDVTAAEIDTGGGEGAVRLLGGGGGRDGGPGFKLAPVGHLQTRNRHAGADDDLLLAVLIFHCEDGAVHTGDGLADRAIGHGAVGGTGPPRPMSVAIAAHAVGKDAQLHGLLSAVGLRNAAAGDIVARLDVGGRCLHPGDN